MFFRQLFIYAFLLFSVAGAQSSDALKLTLKQADSLFLKQNLYLLAGQYDLAVAESQIVQSRLYPNPVFTADVNVYDPDNNKMFHVGNTGQKVFQLEQLIVLGGKRKSEILLARQNKERAKLEFEDLLRNLKYQLHSSFYLIRQQEIVLRKYNQQIRFVDTLVSNYELQATKGNLPVKDVVRLKAVYLQLNNERSELLSSHVEEMAKLRLLLNTLSDISPVIEDERFSGFTKPVTLEELHALALENRPDIKIAALDKNVADVNLRYQKQLAIPDVALNTSYDQRGGAFNNQINGGLTMPLPLRNRNKGNIRSARQLIAQSTIQEQQKKNELQSEVGVAYKNMIRSVKEYRKAQQLYNSDFETVFKGVSENFQKRNISLLEFVDFVESYNESIAELERIKTQLAISAEKINFITTSEVY